MKEKSVLRPRSLKNVEKAGQRVSKSCTGGHREAPGSARVSKMRSKSTLNSWKNGVAVTVCPQRAPGVPREL